MLKQILLSLLILPSIVACDKQQPVTPAVPAAPTASQSSAPTSTPMLQSVAPSPAPTPPPAAPTSTPAPTKKAAPTAPVAGGGDLAKGEAVYKQACSVCHAAGVAGAPKLSDKANWQPRIAQGKAVLYGHAIKGFTGSIGMMPAKGGNSSLSDDDVMAAVDYMVAQGK